MPVQCTCARCGAVFGVKPAKASTATYCSRACKDGERIARTCARCGAAFTVKRSKAETARYCSVACHNGSRPIRACERCGVTFSVKAHKVADGKGKYCSKACQNAAGRIHDEATWWRRTPEYRSWHGLKARCLNPHATGYANWGGRGITVCDRWRDSFENFLADVGRKPSPRHSLDRTDVNGNYEPGNVRWATPSEQRRNQRR